MMSTVFLSGSRKISRLNDAVRNRLKNMTQQGFRIVIGDANGADKALQGYLADSKYENVIVFCAGGVCRNNVGRWDVRVVEADSQLRGRDFYAQKDKAMAEEADFGFVLWDGKSVGSLGNVLELLKRGKYVVVYLSPEKSFFTLKRPDDLRALLSHCDERDYRYISERIRIDRRLRDLDNAQQPELIL